MKSQSTPPVDGEPRSAALDLLVYRTRRFAPAARIIATWFGTGLSPYAPGACGALGAIPVFLVLRVHPIGLSIAILLLSVVGIWAAEIVARERSERDPQRVVVDEVVGVLIAMGLAAGGPWRALAAFIGFRIIDMWKPWPVSAAEHYGPAGFAVMADDILAGLIVGLVLRFV